MSFLSDFETTLTSAFVSGGGGGPSAIISSTASTILLTFKGAFVVGFMIWIMLIAYEVAWGKTEDGMAFLLTRIGKIFLIGAFAFEGWPAVQELLIAIQQAFVSAVSGSTTISSALDTNIINPMLLYFYSILDGFGTALSVFSWTDPKEFLGLMINGIVVAIAYLFLWIIAIGICIVTMAMYFVSLASFYILLAVGPFFLLCLCFPFLQRFFETWVSSAMTAILAMTFTALLATMTAGFLGLGTLAATFPAAGVDLSLGSAPALIFGKAGLAALLIYLFSKVFDMASALGGGMNMGANMIGAMRQLARMNNATKPSSKADPAPGNKIESGGKGTGGSAGSSGAANQANSKAAATGNRGSGSTSVGQFAYNRGAPTARTRYK